MCKNHDLDLKRLTGSDAAVAQVAFDRLWKAICPGLRRKLKGKGLTDDRCEDLLQGTATRLWEARPRLDLPSYGAWWRLACRVATNLNIDEARKDLWTPIDPDEDIPDEDVPYLDLFLAFEGDASRLYALADRVWLGDAEPRATLAVQLFLLDGLPAEEVAQMLGLESLEPLDRWLEQAAVLRRAAFGQLYKSNDELAAFLLGIGPTALDAAEKAVASGRTPADGWSADDAYLLLRRTRNGLLTDQMLRFGRVSEDRAQLESKLMAWVERYPFRRVASHLLGALRRIGQGERLRDDGLWRRLVFQYHAKDELPYLQILDRTLPAADVAGFYLTAPMLNGWIGLGRLWAQLARSAEFYEA